MCIKLFFFTTSKWRENIFFMDIINPTSICGCCARAMTVNSIFRTIQIMYNTDNQSSTFMKVIIITNKATNWKISSINKFTFKGVNRLGQGHINYSLLPDQFALQFWSFEEVPSKVTWTATKDRNISIVVLNIWILFLSFIHLGVVINHHFVVLYCISWSTLLT